MIPNRYLPGVQQSSQEKACLYLDILKSTVHLHSYRHHCSLFHLTHTVIIVMIQSLRKPNLLSKIVHYLMAEENSNHSKRPVQAGKVCTFPHGFIHRNVINYLSFESNTVWFIYQLHNRGFSLGFCFKMNGAISWFTTSCGFLEVIVQVWEDSVMFIMFL